jgi:hypothetical protein
VLLYSHDGEGGAGGVSLSLLPSSGPTQVGTAPRVVFRAVVRLDGGTEVDVAL